MSSLFFSFFFDSSLPRNILCASSKAFFVAKKKGEKTGPEARHKTGPKDYPLGD